MTQQVDGHEAYRDDATYTAPEMQPGHGEDLTAQPNHEFAAATGAAMTGAGGAALAGQLLVEEIEDENAEMRPRHGT